MPETSAISDLKIGLVGPCAAGKTTLARRLGDLGYQARIIAQEHSYVPDMWQRLTNPDILIYLSVSYQNTKIRRRMFWTEAEYQEQLFRLRHAIAHADLRIETDQLTADQVLEQMLTYLSLFTGKPKRA
jgi:deoxyadenosine/deoxycytidine kinase